jgi:hypothetical protein
METKSFAKRVTLERFCDSVILFAFFEVMACVAMQPATRSMPQYIFGFHVVAVLFAVAFSAGLVMFGFSMFLTIQKTLRGEKFEVYTFFQIVLGFLVFAYTAIQMSRINDDEIWYLAFGCCAIPLVAAYIPYLFVKTQRGLPEQKLGQK